VPQSPGGDGPPPPPPPPADPQKPSWPLWTAFVALLSGLLCGNVLGAIVYSIAGASGYDTDPLPVGFMLLANLLFDAALVVSAVVFARLGGRVSPAILGLRPAKAWFAVKWAAAAAITYFVVSALWIGLLHLENETDDITKTLKDDPTAATVAGIALFAVVIAPIVEELFFRGFVFPALREKLNVGWAAIGTGLLFGAVHAFGSPIGFLVPLAVLGTLLCLLYWKTGSIYPCIALHAVNNCIALGSALGWDWQLPLLVAGALAAITAILAPLGRLNRRVGALA
jgi:membrane protease YdiL (CAAX protease family)